MTPTCEGCPAPATCRDRQDVPLCDACFDALPLACALCEEDREAIGYQRTHTGWMAAVCGACAAPGQAIVPIGAAP